MQLKKMFEKDIQRDIKGVIKIGQGDELNIYHELDEYIVTRELKKHFSDFLQSYRKGIDGYTDKMGVWISGFFGSGKSHFLKILSYIIENRGVSGKQAVEYFDGKIEDPMTLAEMMRAGKGSADVILFNIDSKSDSDSKNNKDAIVKVFNKVFDEMQGFCGSIPWLADLERQLVKDGTYEDFKAKFQEESDSEWEESREDIYFEADSVINSLAAVTKMSEESARSWYEKAEENYHISIEKFAKRVNEYIEGKGDDHHVVFLVDEIGQYIGENTQLMLNLQTVVEDLGTFCKGKAWVIVTSQQDIDSITKVKGNDFSKIQGRFNTRLSLSSANVDEVIKKRILQKSEPAKSALKMLYDEKEAVLKNLITFSADAAEMKKYKSVDDFVEVYPFIPYQFNLLQAVFTGIRTHGASGMHLSEGERSLLSAFQESALQHVEDDMGVIIPLNAFYRTVEAFLESNIRTVILHAQDNDNLDEFDVEVLKVLFMIKYVKEMPSNVENIATLMVSSIDEDKVLLKKRIDISLKKLLKETLIQKNGEEYIFLTNEEQDVNKEIKAIPVDVGEVVQKIGEDIFEGILSELKKIKHKQRYYFEYNRIIDERFYSGQKHEMGLKVITPYFDSGEELSDQVLKMMSVRENNLIVKMPMDVSYLEEMRDVLQIQTYIKRKAGSGSTSKLEEIRVRKQREVSERKGRIMEALVDNLKNADMYANSQKLDIKPKHPKERITEGFRQMIESTYTKLAYINSHIESSKDLFHIVSSSEVQQDFMDEKPNKLALDEINGFLSRNTERHIPTTMKSVIESYSKAPYGWMELDIAGAVLGLFKEQEIMLEMANEYLVIKDPDLIKYVTKRDYIDRVLIKKRTKISASLINSAKEVCREVFGQTGVPSDEDGLMGRVRSLFESEIADIKRLLENYKSLDSNAVEYPGRQVLEEGLEHFGEILGRKDVKEFYEELRDRKEDLLDYEEDSVDVKKFFAGEQRIYFDRAIRELDIYNENSNYVIDRQATDIIGSISSIVKSSSPYREIKNLPGLIDDFTIRFTELLEKECEPVRNVIKNDMDMVVSEIRDYGFSDRLMPEFKGAFETLLKKLDSAHNFYKAIAMKEESDRLKQRCFEKIENAKAEAEREKERSRRKHPEEAGQPKEPEYKVKKIKHVSMANILHGARTIESMADIEAVLEHIRKSLETELDDECKIKLI